MNIDYSQYPKRTLRSYKPWWVIPVDGPLLGVMSWPCIVVGIITVILGLISLDLGTIWAGVGALTWGWVVISLRWYQR